MKVRENKFTILGEKREEPRKHRSTLFSTLRSVRVARSARYIDFETEELRSKESYLSSSQFDSQTLYFFVFKRVVFHRTSWKLRRFGHIEIHSFAEVFRHFWPRETFLPQMLSTRIVPMPDLRFAAFE